MKIKCADQLHNVTAQLICVFIFAYTKSDSHDTAHFADLHDVKNITDPMTKVKPGLVATGDTPIDLKGVHIRAKMLDMASEVI